jgi:hypothetical protein
LGFILHPSAFVFLSESRTHGSEAPFYGTSPTNGLGTSDCCDATETSRHNAGANLTYSDGQTAYFPHSYIAGNVGTRPWRPRPSGHKLDL